MDEKEASGLINSIGISLSSTPSTIDVVGGDIEEFRAKVCSFCSKKGNLVGDINPKRCYTGVNQGGLCNGIALSSYLA